MVKQAMNLRTTRPAERIVGIPAYSALGRNSRRTGTPARRDAEPLVNKDQVHIPNIVSMRQREYGGMIVHSNGCERIASFDSVPGAGTSVLRSQKTGRQNGNSNARTEQQRAQQNEQELLEKHGRQRTNPPENRIGVARNLLRSGR